jgi:hypothetical protein
MVFEVGEKGDCGMILASPQMSFLGVWPPKRLYKLKKRHSLTLSKLTYYIILIHKFGMGKSKISETEKKNF